MPTSLMKNRNDVLGCEWMNAITLHGLHSTDNVYIVTKTAGTEQFLMINNSH